MRFSRSRGGIRASLAEVEVNVLGQCVDDLLVLLGGSEEGAQQDPLAAMVGLPTGDPERPADPALARLLPDAYGDDPAASREFRRYTDADLRARKRADAATVRASLPYGRGKVVLDRDQADAWLGVLNDLRLVLGTRLEVTEETDLDGLDESDPRRQALSLYGWLGWVQESLLTCLDPRT